MISVDANHILGSAGLDASQVEVLLADGRLEVCTLNLELSQRHIGQYASKLYQLRCDGRVSQWHLPHLNCVSGVNDPRSANWLCRCDQ